MKTEKELKELAKSMFENHKDEQVFYGTADGQFFPQKNYNDAANHARDHKWPSPIPFTRNEVMNPSPESSASAGDTSEAVNAGTDIRAAKKRKG